MNMTHDVKHFEKSIRIEKHDGSFGVWCSMKNDLLFDDPVTKSGVSWIDSCIAEKLTVVIWRLQTFLMINVVIIYNFHQL